MRRFSGFTLVELMVSMGILAIIFVISTVTLSTIVPNTSQAAANDTLISDIKSQQTSAMSNDSYYGVHFETGSYTIFTGSSYSANNSTNFVVNLDPTVTFTGVSWPGSQIIFTPGSGDVSGYVSNSDSFSLTNSQTGKVTTVKINKYGTTY